MTELKENELNGDYKVIGEFIKKKPVKEDEGFLVTTIEGIELRVKAVGYYKRYKYKVSSYLQVGEDEYVAVLKRNYKFPIIILLLLIALLLGGYFLWKSNQGPDIDPAIKDYVSSLKRPDNLDKTQIAVPGITNLVMDAGTDRLTNTTLFNPKGNPCYFQYILILDQGHKVLYESKLIPPGKGISGIQLNQKMKRGTYPVTLKINTFDLEDYETPLNGAEVKGTLRALE